MGMNLGDKVPDFTAYDDKGNVFESSSVIGQRVVVLYFYPKNFTPGCIKEACDFRDHYVDFKKLGAEIIGISSDSSSSHKKFKLKYQLPFTFLADKDGHLRQIFEVKSLLFGLLPGRETFVIDKNGVLKYRFNSINASSHLGEALKIVKELADG